MKLETSSQRQVIFILVIIVLIAIFFRFWQLDKIPPGLYSDEAINANEAVTSVKTLDFKVFYPENNGREGLFIWLIAFSFSLFGISIWSLKFVTATFGILTIISLYLLAKELLNTKTALVASFFLSVSFWHVNFSRIGFRAILALFLLVTAFYFIWRGFNKRNFVAMVLGGILFGLGFYTYIIFRIAVLLLGLVLFLQFLVYTKKGQLQTFFKLSAICLVFTFITALPIGLYFLNNPQDFVGRASQVSIFEQPDPLQAFFESTVSHLAMFNVAGDYNWRHNFAGSPQLLWPIGILFLAGFIIVARNLFSLDKNFKPRFYASCFMMGWFCVMLLPALLTKEGMPHALRSIGTIPIAYIFAAIGGVKLYECSKKIINKKLLSIVCLLFIFLLVLSQFNKYFISWSSRQETKDSFSSNYVSIANYLNSLPENIQKLVLVNTSGVPVPWPDGIPMPAQTIMFMEAAKFGETQSNYLLPGDIDKAKINQNPAVIIPMEKDESLFLELKSLFPNGQVIKENEIDIYKVNF